MRDASFELVDVDSDDELHAQYKDHVPVLIVDGKVHSYWFVDEDELASLV